MTERAMKTKRKTHMAFFENGDYWMCDCELDDIHNVEDEPQRQSRETR